MDVAELMPVGNATAGDEIRVRGVWLRIIAVQGRFFLGRHIGTDVWTDDGRHFYARPECWRLITQKTAA